jgi:hypothetical protein
MSFSESIRHAQQRAWPAVRASLIRVRASRDVVLRDPHNATTAALARAKRNWDHVVADETVWALAKDGLLATEENAAVVRAAQAWVRTWDLQELATMDGEERALYEAVQLFSASLRDMSDVA